MDRTSLRRRICAVVEVTLIAVAIVSTGLLAARTLARAAAQQADRREAASWARERPGAAAKAAPASAAAADRPASRTDGFLGVIAVPRLGLRASIRDGVGDAVLDVAVGRIPGTSETVHAGNLGLAAHRDTLFRPLRHVRLNDVVRIETAEGAFTYRVTNITIVDPEDVWVLNQSRTPAVTLVTCYPFSYVGSAPRRFVVRAERVAPSPRDPVPAVTRARP
jgi:sortase A